MIANSGDRSASAGALYVAGSIAEGFGIPLFITGAVISKTARIKLKESKKRYQRVTLMLNPNILSIVYNY